MEDVEKFYLFINSELRVLQTKSLKKEKNIPLKLDLYEKRKNSRKARRINKKAEKQRLKIEKGYHKAIEECICKINKIYKEFCNRCSDN